MSNNFLCAKCIIIVSFVCLFGSISNAGWVVLATDNFESGLGNWTTDGGDCTWVRNQDFTPSGSTGPCGCSDAGSGYDHTIGDETGWYAYVEASGSVCEGSDLEAVLEGPNLDADTYSSFVLSFYYHMFGSNMGDLHVDVYNGSSWDLDVYVLSGQQQSNGTDGYLQSADVTLDSYTGTIKVRFRYDGVSGYAADVAIDDIEISGLTAVPQVTVPNVVGLDQATAEANITAVGLTVGSIGEAFSNTVAIGNVMSQLPTAGTEIDLGSSVNITLSKGTPATDFEDLVAFAANWLTTGCGLCNGQDYTGDYDVDLEDYAFFAQEWLETPPATLVINEFMASNDTIIADGFGEYDDWIEIYNYGTEQLTLSGMYLNDSANSYLIPSIPALVTINAGEYKIFWADNQDTQGSLHTNFGLSAGGDEIYLYDTDGVSLIDSITYRADQETDISHGRFPDNTPNWYNMDDPTPGLTNTAGMAGDVWFSKVSGTFTSNFTLKLFTETPTATIRYTTNGSIPTSGSTAYSASTGISITNSGAKRICARAFDPTLAPSNVTDHYYTPLASDISGINEFKSNLPIVIIDTHGAGMDWWEFSNAYSTVFIDLDKDTGLASMQDIPDYAGRSGLHIRGESSTEWPKNQYALEFWDENNVDEKHSLLGMPSESDWILNAPYGDKTLMRNVLAYKWGNDIMPGFAAPGTRFVEVFLNDDGGNCSYGDYNGVYVLMEKLKISSNRLDIGKLTSDDNTEPEVTGGYLLRVDKPSTEHENFTTSANMVGSSIQYYDPDGSVLTTAQHDWIEGHFDDFEGVLSPLNTDPVAGYPSYIEVENFQETDVILELFKNIDGFKLSTYFYKEKNGKIFFGPMWDYNFSSGNNTNPGWGFWASYSMATNTTDGENWWNDNFNVYGWHNRLMNDIEYKLGTADKWFEHREDKLSNAQIITDIDNYYAYLTTNVTFSGGADNAADRNFARWDILNSWVSCNYYHGNNSTEPEQGNIPHTYYMEKEWLKNWFTGQGTSAPGESYIANYTDRAGIVDAFWESDRNMVAPPSLFIDGSPMDTGGTITAGATLTMTAATSGTIYYTLDGTDPRQAVTGNAVGSTYGSGITLNETKQVKARILNSGNWSALNEATFSDDRMANSLRITEVMYNPADPNDEFIEFKNIGASTINLAQCQLTKGVDFTFPIMTLAPNAYTIVTRNQAHFLTTYPGYSGSIAGEYTLVDKLDNGGENIRLKDAAGVIIQEFDYEDGWFPITDGMGYSINSINLTPTDPNEWNKRLSWEASNVSGGTPGAAPTANAVGNEDIVINEILTHTDNSEGDWIEIHNASGGIIDVGGWYLSDNKNNLKKYRIQSPTNIPSGGYLVLTATTHFRNALDPGSAVQFGLSEHGEDIFLTSGDGSDIDGGYSDGESFGSARNGVTFGRYTKGAPTYNTDFIELAGMTQGAVNSAPYVPDVVITEIMYNAQDIQDQLGEYIELHNRGAGAVNLYNGANPWKFTKGIDFTFPTGVSIVAGEKILISRTHPEAFKIANGDPGVTVYGPFASGTELENDGEKIELSMPTDPDPGTGFFSYIRVEQVNYSDGIHPLVGDPWPTSADGRGDSLHRTTLSNYANDVANWSAGTPSPGS